MCAFSIVFKWWCTALHFSFKLVYRGAVLWELGVGRAGGFCTGDARAGYAMGLQQLVKHYSHVEYTRARQCFEVTEVRWAFCIRQEKIFVLFIASLQESRNFCSRQVQT
jgi:hypothetical protein